MKLRPDAVILTKEEWMILAAKAGIDHIWGFDDFEPDSITEKKFVQMLFHMLQEKLLYWKDDYLQTSFFLKDMFEKIKLCEMSFLLFPTVQKDAAFCCYLTSEQLILVKRNVRNHNEICLRYLTSGQLISEIDKTGWLPSESILQNELKKSSRKSSCFVKRKELYQTKELYGFMDLTEVKSGDVIQRLIITEEELCPMLIRQTVEWQESACFSRKKMNEWIQSMLGGVENDSCGHICSFSGAKL